mmetsp:Transcript_45747/g.138694  ORF Transcript_45747/g.138694 Transcript_45747/m.138694 type:complete len:248 (+) Transcript_45747:2-745(+)
MPKEAIHEPVLLNCSCRVGGHAERLSAQAPPWAARAARFPKLSAANCKVEKRPPQKDRTRPMSSVHPDPVREASFTAAELSSLASSSSARTPSEAALRLQAWIAATMPTRLATTPTMYQGATTYVLSPEPCFLTCCPTTKTPTRKFRTADTSGLKAWSKATPSRGTAAMMQIPHGTQKAAPTTPHHVKANTTSCPRMAFARTKHQPATNTQKDLYAWNTAGCTRASRTAGAFTAIGYEPMKIAPRMA